MTVYRHLVCWCVPLRTSSKLRCHSGQVDIYENSSSHAINLCLGSYYYNTAICCWTTTIGKWPFYPFPLFTGFSPGGFSMTAAASGSLARGGSGPSQKVVLAAATTAASLPFFFFFWQDPKPIHYKGSGLPFPGCQLTNKKKHSSMLTLLDTKVCLRTTESIWALELHVQTSTQKYAETIGLTYYLMID